MLVLRLFRRFAVCTAMAYAVAILASYYAMNFEWVHGVSIHIVCVGFGLGGIFYGPLIYDWLKEYAEPFINIMDSISNFFGPK